MMKKLFENSTAIWTRFGAYEWKETGKGELFLVPTKDSEFGLYNVFDDIDSLVLDAATAAVKCFKARNDKKVIMKEIQDFVCKYGLLGIMKALPGTADFMRYEKVYLPKNLLFRDEVMDTMEYINYFFPFATPCVKRNKEFLVWDEESKIIVSFTENPPENPAITSSDAIKAYGEKYEWLEKIFKDWGFMFLCAAIYRNEIYAMPEVEYKLLRTGLAAFNGNAPTYHICLEDGPKLEWDFHSLMLITQLMMSLMITDSDRPLRMCERCEKPFIARGKNVRYCSKECRENSRGQ